VLMC